MNATRNVYLAIKGDVVVHHTDLSAMAQMDGISKPDMTITEEEFEAAGSIARVIDGKIFLGKTDKEKKIEADKKRIAEIDERLSEIDTLAARCSRAVAYAFATGGTPGKEDVAKVKEYEEEAGRLREERSKLEKEIEKLI